MTKLEFNFEYPKKLHPVLTTDKRYILLKGGRGGGKSHFLARKFIIDRLHQKRDLICVREYQRNLEQSNYKLFKTLIEKYKLPFQIKSDKIISLTTGSEIIFEGMNNLTEDNIKSYEGFNDAWIEEAHKFSRSSFQKLNPTIRAEGSKIYISMNPDFEDDAVLDEITKIHHDNSLIIHINYNENPFCPQILIDQAEAYKKYMPDEYRHIYLGECKIGSGRKIVKNWSGANERDIPYLKELPMIVGMDFNRDPMCWVLAHKDKEALYFFDEYARENTWIKPSIKELLDLYKDHEGGFVICGDASGNQLRSEGEGSCFTEIYNEFTRRGFRQIKPEEIENREYFDVNKQKHASTEGGKYFAFNLSNANPSRTARFNSFNNRIVDEFGQHNIFVNKSKCRWLYYNIMNLKQKAGSNEFDIPTNVQIKNDPTFANELKYLGHPYDAASYIVYKYWNIEKECDIIQTF
jgi:hypothetical protein